jgi:hypothetical protein
MDILEHIGAVGALLHDARQNSEATKALDEERKKLAPGETKQIEIVTRGGPLMQGGNFVRFQDAQPGQKSLDPSEVVGPTFTLYGFLPSRPFTPQQKEEMAANADLVRAAELLEKAEQAAKKASDDEAKRLETRQKAEKARQELEAAEAARVREIAELEAASKAKEKAQAEAKAADARAAKADRDAERNGRKLEHQIQNERERFRKEGGVHRAPA